SRAEITSGYFGRVTRSQSFGSSHMRKGRFRKALEKIAQRYSESISFDRRLYPHDIAGSIAHAAALSKAGIISGAENKKIETGLREIEREIDSGKFAWDESLEDVHMNIERALTKKIGEAGAKLHTARSRNDQVALDLELIARQLGFSRVSRVIRYAVCDRGFACEFIFCLVMIGMHLSRLSEDLIIWSTAEFGFIELSEGFSTGSSLMPQEKNPDMAELTRGKTGRLYGNLMSILTILKALPSSYNRDLQEDKEAVFDSVDTVSA